MPFVQIKSDDNLRNPPSAGGNERDLRFGALITVLGEVETAKTSHQLASQEYREILGKKVGQINEDQLPLVGE